CTAGAARCCNYVTTVDDPAAATILKGLIDVIVRPITALVGLGCTPITVVGTGGGANCTQQPVCCTDNRFERLVSRDIFRYTPLRS
ncbi:hypothetical protein M422DRAFT_173821, partial [Sphaerobolus stellatus SS14]